MNDKAPHLRAVPDLPPEEEQPLVREDGIITGIPGPLPSAATSPAIGEVLPPMPDAESGTPAEIKQFDEPDEESASVLNHPSNPKPPTDQ